MTYTVTLTADSRDELILQIERLTREWRNECHTTHTSDTPHKTEATQNPGTQDDQPELPIEDEPPAEDPEEPDAPEPEPAPEPEQTAPATKPVDVDTLRKQLTAYAEANGNTKARELVASWGKVSDVPADQRNAIYEAAGGEL